VRNLLVRHLGEGGRAHGRRLPRGMRDGPVPGGEQFSRGSVRSSIVHSRPGSIQNRVRRQELSGIADQPACL